MRKSIKNKHVRVAGMITRSKMPLFEPRELTCIITNDERGKTLSIGDGTLQFTIPFEPIERYLK